MRGLCYWGDCWENMGLGGKLRTCACVTYGRGWLCRMGETQRFLFRYIIFSTVFGLKRFLFLLTISPHFENSRSQGTDEAGVHQHCFASLKRWGFCQCFYGIVVHGLKHVSKLQCRAAITRAAHLRDRLHVHQNPPDHGPGPWIHPQLPGVPTPWINPFI